MGALDVLGHLRALGLALEASGGNIVARPREAMTDEARRLIREHKAGLLMALGAGAEGRRARVLAMLDADPSMRIAVACDGEGDPVAVAVAIRDKGACEVLIPAARFDPFALLELVARHGGQIH